MPPTRLLHFAKGQQMQEMQEMQKMQQMQLNKLSQNSTYLSTTTREEL